MKSGATPARPSLLRGHHHISGPETCLERLDVLRGREHIVMTGQEIGTRRGPRDGTLVAQYSQGVIRHARRGIERVNNHQRYIPMAANAALDADSASSVPRRLRAYQPVVSGLNGTHGCPRGMALRPADDATAWQLTTA